MWGSTDHGGDPSQAPSFSLTVYSNAYAFAALKEDGSLTSWGNA